MVDGIGFKWRIGAMVVATGLAIGLAPQASAQSGSVGGSIGKEDKSVSGSQAPAAPARSLPQPAQAAPRAKGTSRAGSSGGSFDGAWAVVAIGNDMCPGTTNGATVVTSGRVIGSDGTTGQVSPSGIVNTVANANGVTIYGTGRLSGRSGSGTFRRSDGCTGRWTAMKQ
jgi:hypothetical protein